MISVPSLGAHLRALRRAAGLTQSELAARVGMRQEALSRFENGRSADFSLAKLLRLAEALGLDVKFLPVGARPTLDEVLKERQAPADRPR